MTQRILLGFDALDKYSRDILAKHAKKQTLSCLQGLRSLQIPLTFDFGLEGDQDADRESARSKPPLEIKMPAALSPRDKIVPDYAQPVIQPFAASADRSLQRGCVPTTERKSKKIEKTRCVSATRRRNWQSEVDSVPKLGTLCLEDNLPILALQDVSFVSPRSPPPVVRPDMHFNVGSTGNTMERTCDSRQYNTNVDRVSLSIDDELIKSDVKVITPREKTRGAHIETAVDTKPDTYQKENMCVFFSTLSDLKKHVPAKQIHFSSSQWPADSVRPTTGTSLVTQNNTNYAKDLMNYRQTKSPSSTLKNKTIKRSLSANAKLNIQFLSADGTKQKAELLREEKEPTDRQFRYREVKKICQESKPCPRPDLAWEERAQLSQLGTVINGVNPKKTVDYDPGSHSRPQQASKSSGSSSARPSVPRPNSVVEMQRWSYITISKPLSPPGHQQGSSEVGSLFPVVASHLVKDSPRSGRRRENSPNTLSTRPLVLEARKVRQSSLPVEIHPQGVEIQTQQAEKTLSSSPRQDNRTQQGDNFIDSPWSSPLLGKPEMKSPVHEFSSKQTKKSGISTAHHTTIPVISIPTAQIDTSE
ncbi:uncharacterized protein [Aquarana catesbeiana]|uniref:uncharacterized protein isoform X2 n=1 Tax=Aquarana catesbeiana TaxID=8400 RepID=UPI003CC930F8